MRNKDVPIELDHVFIFTQEHDPLADALKNIGLYEGTLNVHQGQGTACKRFFFHNAYLELVWVINQDEVKSEAIAKTKLWERSQYQLSRYCPFGLCFRTRKQLSDSITLFFDDGWHYYSKFLPEGQFANIASNEDLPAEPLLFEMPFFGIAPKDYPLGKQQLLHHPRDFKEITAVSSTLLTNMKNLSPDMKKVAHESIVHLSEGKEYWVCLEFDYGIKGASQNFYPLAQLTLKW